MRHALILMLLFLSACITTKKAENKLLENGSAAAFCARNFPYVPSVDSTSINVSLDAYKKLMRYVDSLERPVKDTANNCCPSYGNLLSSFEALQDAVRAYKPDTAFVTRYKYFKDTAAEDSIALELRKIITASAKQEKNLTDKTNAAIRETEKVKDKLKAWRKAALISSCGLLLGIIGLAIKIFK